MTPSINKTKMHNFLLVKTTLRYDSSVSSGQNMFIIDGIEPHDPQLGDSRSQDAVYWRVHIKIEPRLQDQWCISKTHYTSVIHHIFGVSGCFCQNQTGAFFMCVLTTKYRIDFRIKENVSRHFRYRKNPDISPVLIQLHKGFWEGL